MKTLLILFLFILTCDNNGSKKVKKNHFVDEISKDSIFSHIKIFSDFGIKNFGSEGNKNTRDWIVSKLESYGYTPEIHEFTANNTIGKNIIAEKVGDTDATNYIILDGHYDSVSRGPGANDNGSGVAIILEIARVLSLHNSTNHIKFIFFDAEEVGLTGSNIYANKVKNKGDIIDFVLNIDMVGGHKDMTHWKIVCEEDQNGHSGSDSLSNQLNLKLIQSVKDYTTLTPVVDETYGSDYVWFEKNGYTVIGLYEYHGQESNPTYHKATDTYDNIHKSYTYEVSKAALGFISDEIGLY